MGRRLSVGEVNGTGEEARKDRGNGRWAYGQYERRRIVSRVVVRCVMWCWCGAVLGCTELMRVLCAARSNGAEADGLIGAVCSASRETENEVMHWCHRTFSYIRGRGCIEIRGRAGNIVEFLGSNSC